MAAKTVHICMLNVCLWVLHDSNSNPPIKAEQTNLHGFLPGFYWPDYVSNLSIPW